MAMKLSFGRKTPVADKPESSMFSFGWVVGVAPFGPDMIHIGLDRDPAERLRVTAWLSGDTPGGEAYAEVSVGSSMACELSRWGQESAGCWRWQAQARCSIKPRGREDVLDIPAIALCYGPNDSRLPFRIDSPVLRANPGRYVLLVEIKPEFLVQATQRTGGPVYGCVFVEPKQMSEFYEWVKRRRVSLGA
jgi:hypothetical protein